MQRTGIKLMLDTPFSCASWALSEDKGGGDDAHSATPFLLLLLLLLSID
jgi:hypothetical protein